MVVLGVVRGSHGASAAVSAPHLTVVVQRGGGRVVAGEYDDAKRRVSHTVQTTGRSEVTMPAFEGTDAEWRGLMSCTRSQYRGLPVDFVEQAPASGDYLLVFVGGSARNLGQTQIWGLSSAGSRAVVPHGVGFVFSADDKLDNRGLALCMTLTHEVGHMLGLDHSTDCNDVMSTAIQCKQFEYKLRGFRPANRSILESSLASWAKAHEDPETRVTYDANSKTQKTRALARPQHLPTRPIDTAR